MRTTSRQQATRQSPPTPKAAPPPPTKAAPSVDSATHRPSSPTPVDQQSQRAKQARQMVAKGSHKGRRPTLQANGRSISLSQHAKTQQQKIKAWLDRYDLGVKLTVETKEKLIQLIDSSLKALTGGSSKEMDNILKGLGKAKSGAGLAKSLAELAVEANKPNPNKRVALSKMIAICADGFALLPEKIQNKLVNRISRMMSKARKLRPLARMMTAVHRAGAAPEMMKVASGIIAGDAAEIAKGFKDLGQKLVTSHPKTLAKLVYAATDLLPARTKARFLARMGLRKASGIGTIIAAVGDGVEIGRGLFQWFRGKGARTLSRGFFGLLSTGAGLVPGPGTAASFAIELGLLAEDISHIAAKLGKHP